MSWHPRIVAGVEDWSRAHWFVTFPGLADAWLWGFDVDGRWRLRHGNPAMSSLAILPMDVDAAPATLEDAAWLADCLAYDHDAPVGVRPSSWNKQARFPHEPIHPLPGGDSAHWYFDNLGTAFLAAAEARFGDSYCLRYDDEDRSAPGTDFTRRFAGREHQLALYAMAARQADILTEYLCLYRVLEAADGTNGMEFASEQLGAILTRDFGTLRIIPHGRPDAATNAFEVYKERAARHIEALRRRGVASDREIAEHLYAIRNSLAHGRREPRVGDFSTSVEEVASALSVAKLLARLAIES